MIIKYFAQSNLKTHFAATFVAELFIDNQFQTSPSQRGFIISKFLIELFEHSKVAYFLLKDLLKLRNVRLRIGTFFQRIVT
jgi:hypothetical protein